MSLKIDEELLHPAQDDWSAPAVVHRWLVKQFPQFGFGFLTKAVSGGALLADACTYMWRDFPGERQGASVFYDGMRVTYNLWTAKPRASSLSEGEFQGVLADPTFCERLRNALDEDLQSNSHIYRPSTSEDEEGSREAGDQTPRSRDSGEGVGPSP